MMAETIEQGLVRIEMRRKLCKLNEADLDKELSFIESFGTEIHPNAGMWLEEVRAEKERRA